MQHLDLIRQLAAATAGTTDVDRVLAVSLEVVCEHLGSEAGVVWRAEPGGRWTVTSTHGVGRETAVGRQDVTPVLDGGGTQTAVEVPSVVQAMVRTRTPASAYRVSSERRGGEPAGDAAGDERDVHAAILVSADVPPPAVLHLELGDVSIDGRVLLAICETVGELLRRVAERAADQARLAETEKVAGVGSWRWDIAADRTDWSDQMCANFGVDPVEFEPSLEDYLGLVHPADREEVRRVVTAALRDREPFEVVHRTTEDEAGSVRWIEGHGQVHNGPGGEPAWLSGTAQDITDRKRLEQEVVHRATHDALTGLPNQAAFQQRLASLLESSGDAWSVAVAILDVDRFGKVTGRLDPAAGDELLAAIADRLADRVPASTAVARLGGDEFAVLAPGDGHGPRHAVELGQAVLRLFADPFQIGDEHHGLDASVGVATNATGSESADELIRDAGIAVDLAKARGGGRCQLFDPDHHEQALQRLALEADLRRAVGHGELTVAYQPVVSLDTGEMVGTEALARWERPGHGPVPPGTFVPMAEELGLASQLGAHILLTACQQAATWQQEFPRAAGPTVAVNLSALQLDDPQVVEVVDEALARSGLDPEHLMLEITESALPSDAPAALARLWELRRRGIKIAIDDFGTGYSTLSRLRDLPVDVLKIDRSFLRDVDNGTPILGALFSMADTLDLEVIAEGVETPRQLLALLAHGCDEAQGYLFSQPLDAEAATRLLRDPTWDLDEEPAVTSQETAPDPGQRRLELLLAALDEAETPAQIRESLRALLDAIAEAIGMDSVYVTEIDLEAGRQTVEIAANRGKVDIPSGLSVAWSDTLCRRALGDGRTAIVDVTAMYPDLEVAVELGIGTYVSAPITTPSGGLRGTLCAVASRPNACGDGAAELLRHVGRLLDDHLRSLEGPDGHDTDGTPPVA